MKNKITICLIISLLSVLLGNTSMAAERTRLQLPYLENLQPKTALQKDSIIKKEAPRLSLKKPKDASDDRDYSGRRIGYLGLFVLGVFLSYAMLVFSFFGLFGGGILLSLIGTVLSSYLLAGGIYFLMNAFSENVKPYLEMDIPQKKRERRKFGFTWLGVLLFFGFTLSSAFG